MLHSLRGASLCLGQMVKNAADNNDSSHGGTNISCIEAPDILKPSTGSTIHVHKLKSK
jgi:hypothetical protein